MGYWRFELVSQVQAQFPVRPALIAHLRGSFDRGTGEGDVEFVGAMVRAELPGLEVQWPDAFVPCEPQLLRASFDATASLRVELPMDASLLRRIEDKRASRPGDVTLVLWVGARYRLLRELEAKVAQYPMYESSQVLSDNGHRDVRVDLSRDHWLRLLTAFAHGQFEVFELPMPEPTADPRLKEAMSLLKEAAHAYRTGAWETTLVQARKAAEITLTGELGDRDLKQGAIKLGENLFPKPGEEARRQFLNGLLGSLAPLRHAAAHAKGDRFHPRREDAEMTLVLALQLFRYVSQALALQERP